MTFRSYLYIDAVPTAATSVVAFIVAVDVVDVVISLDDEFVVAASIVEPVVESMAASEFSRRSGSYRRHSLSSGHSVTQSVGQYQLSIHVSVTAL